ncbi:conserved hypothetical protein [Photorhabdus asymbiotica]|uniref:Uncharacterized protein n=1 Tax=Photorhabdus asymbiotica subsp. asymbiotica (strain ATCC 43949 / 3105-77) TaxID=553480 RepID=C7BRW0_PHOAA|nr:conserved hypothetical protein [Photorhabdus asymbiotica]
MKKNHIINILLAISLCVFCFLDYITLDCHVEITYVLTTFPAFFLLSKAVLWSSYFISPMGLMNFSLNFYSILISLHIGSYPDINQR